MQIDNEIRTILEDAVKSSARTVRECWSPKADKAMMREKYLNLVENAAQALGIEDRDAWLESLGAKI